MRWPYLLALALVAAPASARLYQWVDPDSGNVYLSGSPPAWYRAGGVGPRVLVFESGDLVDDTGRQASEEEARALREEAVIQEQLRREALAGPRQEADQPAEDAGAGEEGVPEAAADLDVEARFKETVAEFLKARVSQYFEQVKRDAASAVGIPAPPGAAPPNAPR